MVPFMTSMLLSSIVMLGSLIPSKSEWNCHQQKRTCVCDAGKCNMFGEPNYLAYICTNGAKSCTVHCHDAYSCRKAHFYMMATNTAEIVCNGKDSCSNSTIYCGQMSMNSCHITIHHEAMSDGYIKCDAHISPCTVDIISHPNQTALHHTIFECKGKDCHSNINKRHLLTSNSSTTTTIAPFHYSEDFSLPAFTIIEYVVIAISLVFCCGTFAIFVVICYCQRLKYQAIKKYRAAQCMQQPETEDESRENDSNMNTNSNMNSNSNSNESSNGDISIGIQEEDANTSMAVVASRAPIFIESGSSSDLPQLMPFHENQSPFDVGIELLPMDCIDRDHNGVQHHHHIYYFNTHNLSHSSFQLQNIIAPATFHPNHVTPALSLPYSPTTTYHHHPDGTAPYIHTLQIPKLHLSRKSSSHKSLSTLTSITSTQINSGVALSSPHPSSVISDESSPVSSTNDSIYICRFDDARTWSKRSSLKDQKPGSRDFTLHTITDELLLGDEPSNTVHAELPEMKDKELSLSETPEPHEASI